MEDKEKEYERLLQLQERRRGESKKLGPADFTGCLSKSAFYR
jgi:hypothetical protein